MLSSFTNRQDFFYSSTERDQRNLTLPIENKTWLRACIFEYSLYIYYLLKYSFTHLKHLKKIKL